MVDKKVMNIAAGLKRATQRSFLHMEVKYAI